MLNQISRLIVPPAIVLLALAALLFPAATASTETKPPRSLKLPTAIPYEVPEPAHAIGPYTGSHLATPREVPQPAVAIPVTSETPAVRQFRLDPPTDFAQQTLLRQWKREGIPHQSLEAGVRQALEMLDRAQQRQAAY